MDLLSAADLTDETVRGFTAAFGGAPSLVGRAPGRVNLIGEHTDYNAGRCLPTALPHATYAAVRHRTDGALALSAAQAPDWSGTLDDLEPGRTTGAAAYVTGTLWALREAGLGVEGLDVRIDSAVPIGSGLSSSAALICAVAAAVAEGRLSPEELVDVAIRAETEGVGAPTGGLDQTVSVLGRPGEALLLDFGPGADRVTRRVTWRPEAAGLSVLVVDTRVSHSHAGGEYGERRRECAAACTALGVATLREVTDVEALAGLDDGVLVRRARHVVTETGRVGGVVDAVEADDWARVGALFTESHASLRDDFEVSCPELDAVVEASLDAGALGARMTGGGFGGSALVLVADEHREAVADGVLARFAARGFGVPGFLAGTASDGASVRH